MLARDCSTGGEERELALREVEPLELTHRVTAAAEADAAAERAVARERVQLRDREAALLEHIDHHLADEPGRTDDRNGELPVHRAVLHSGCCPRSAARRRDVGSRRFHVRVLRAVTQIMVHEHDRQHGLGNRRSAQTDARIVPTRRHDLNRAPRQVDGAAGHLDAGGWFEGEMRDHVLPRGDAAEHPTGVVAAKTLRRELIAMLAAALRGTTHSGADLHGLHRVDAHERVRYVGVEPVEYRLAEPRWHPRCDHTYSRTDRVALATHLPDQLLDLLDALRIGTEECILVGKGRVHRLEHERPDLAQVTVDAYAEPYREIAPRDGTGGGAHDGLAGRGAPTATVIAHAILLLIS